jgi:hypothetical protein
MKLELTCPKNCCICWNFVLWLLLVFWLFSDSGSGNTCTYKHKETIQDQTVQADFMVQFSNSRWVCKNYMKMGCKLIQSGMGRHPNFLISVSLNSVLNVASNVKLLAYPPSSRLQNL